MKTMSIEEIKNVAKNILNLDPYLETSEFVSFRLEKFASIHSVSFERCDFPRFYIAPFCNSEYECFLELVVFTNDN